MRRSLVLAAALAVMGLGAPTGAYAAVPAGNLLLNPGADQGTGAAEANAIFPPTGWGTSNNFTAVKYGTTNFPSTALGASINGGPNFFAGGRATNPPSSTSSADQVIQVSGAATEIDAGQVSIALGGYLGGLLADTDNAKVVASLEDESSDQILSTLQIGPVTAADRNNQTTLLPRSARANVPVGTRRIRVQITATDVAGDGSYINGYADNLSLTLDRNPVAVNDSKTVIQNSPAALIDVLANDTDPDGGLKRVASVTQPAHGQAAVAAGGTAVTYHPAPGYCKDLDPPDTFKYSLNGGSTATVAIETLCTAQPAQCRQRGLLRIGTPASDAINGTASSDVIFGRAGNDVINGLAADDCLYGEDGSDHLNGRNGTDLILGGRGNDNIGGGPGADRLDGGAGGDRLDGGTGDDRLHGGTGSDRLTGSGGDDSINGNAGNDRIDGSSGGDRISGNSGRDSLSGGTGRDHISGGSGNDRVSARDGFRDTIDCGSGRDRVTADSLDSISRNCESVSRRRGRS